jgi:hypothetical protein
MTNMKYTGPCLYRGKMIDDGEQVKGGGIEL